ncbi:MAG TPA: hypothetical protein VMY99_00790 [Nevskiaceae bacterium]|nr:hypothetical protein [Nevskiaceae bacterium]
MVIKRLSQKHRTRIFTLLFGALLVFPLAAGTQKALAAVPGVTSLSRSDANTIGVTTSVNNVPAPGNVLKASDGKSFSGNIVVFREPLSVTESFCFVPVKAALTESTNLAGQKSLSAKLTADTASATTTIQGPPSNTGVGFVIVNKCSGAQINQYNNQTVNVLDACLNGCVGGGTSDREGDEHETNPTCETSPGAGPLSWILCGIYNTVADSTDWIYSNGIQPLLRMKPIPISDTGSNKVVFELWSAFRLYGDIFLVIALLVIVFGQAIGGGVVEAYTARKALPRLLMAAILINISIYIVAFAVDATNVVGGGLGQIMTAPLTDTGKFNIRLDLSEQATSLGVGGAALIGAGLAGVISLGSLASALPFLLLFAVLPLFLGLLAILITLIVRQALIILLVIVSPVAFALWCLPNTEKYFGQWWELLFRALLIYPMIVALFAIADLMSVIFGS